MLLHRYYYSPKDCYLVADERELQPTEKFVWCFSRKLTAPLLQHLTCASAPGPGDAELQVHLLVLVRGRLRAARGRTLYGTVLPSLLDVVVRNEMTHLLEGLVPLGPLMKTLLCQTQ